MERSCLDCGYSVKGRSDKKFCDDACRNNYNNRLKSEDNRFVKRVNVILRKNRLILSELNPDGKIKVGFKKLQSRGFNFDYFTHLYTTQNANTYYFCYEFGYMKLGEQEFLLVKREEKT